MASEPGNIPTKWTAGETSAAITNSPQQIYHLVLDKDVEHQVVNFHEREQWNDIVFRWSKPLAMVRLFLARNDYNISIETGSLRGDRCDFRFDLYWNKHRIPHREIHASDGKIEFHVDRMLFIDDPEQRLTIACKPVGLPSSSRDTRQLGLPVVSIRCTTAGELPSERRRGSLIAPLRLRRFASDMMSRVFAHRLSPSVPIWTVPQIPLPLSGIRPDLNRPTHVEAHVPRNTLIDVLVTPNEINQLHGTGPLVERVFQGNDNVFCIRSRNDYGMQTFGAWSVCIPQPGTARADWFRRVLDVLSGRNIRNVLCVPYLENELKTAIAAQASFDANLCGWIMDDQNIGSPQIPNDLMYEFLNRCSLRLVTHPELRHVYELKFGMPFHILPAVVPAPLVRTDVVAPDQERVFSRHGALFGSFWDQVWFDKTCEVFQQCHCKLDWFGNHKPLKLRIAEESLRRAKIVPQGVVAESRLSQTLQRYPFVVVPVSPRHEEDSNGGVAKLSLPGRILFALATSHTPILMLGSEQTCGARVVKHFGIGEVVPYSIQQVTEAIDRLIDPENQMRYRQNAAAVANDFSDDGVAGWLEKSIKLGCPVDDRFERAFANYDSAWIVDHTDMNLTYNEGAA